MSTAVPMVPMVRTASFSRDRRYRYRLDRRWADGPRVTWIMLNPSTADAQTDDPTIRRCIDFSRRWDFGEMTVVNLYSWRATRPDALSDAQDPVGPRTNRVLRKAIAGADALIVAWGNVPTEFHHRADEVRETLPAGVSCLGLTTLGHPRHPLYVPASVSPQRFVV